ncbi:hypothetical protein HID58_067612 [Brassica napus]|uniref:Uncharacterized protein n=1 Tax=Brassica napus TaxID=3708 RepID=A0ABQ7ZJ56_BRANA|nr:hypothetical protein HID58_067612 [Brassica napus]
MRVALDFHGVSGGSKSARQGLSRHWSSSEMLQGVIGEGLHRRIVECLCIQGVWTEQRVPLVEFVKSLGLGLIVWRARQQR